MTVIEVFADVACPFTHVGLRRFVDRRRQLGAAELTLHVRSWPLEVVNGEPMDPGFIAEEIDEIREQVAPDLFVGFDREAFPATSLPALTLAIAAYDAGPSVGEAVSLELRDLLFERGVDIADPDTLSALADAHGIAVDLSDHRRVLQDHAEGVARGVVGSPHFFTPTGAFFCPSLTVGRDDEGHLRVTPDPVGLEEFMQSCFG